MTKIKICGLKRQEDILAVNEAKPDFCGFVIEVAKSSRCVSRAQVRALVKDLNREIVPVGVFVDAPLALVVSLLEDGVIDMAQLHGHEDEDYIRQLREKTSKPLIKAFSVKCGADISKALCSTADYILLDKGNGGTGKTFDWSLIPKIKRPYFLAGGLGIENLEDAMIRVKPWAVDLSSSLETDGFKDSEKIRAAVATVRNADKKLSGRSENRDG